jgi:hypothetical protein
MAQLRDYRMKLHNSSNNKDLIISNLNRSISRR